MSCWTFDICHLPVNESLIHNLDKFKVELKIWTNVLNVMELCKLFFKNFIKRPYLTSPCLGEGNRTTENTVIAKRFYKGDSRLKENTEKP